MKRRIIKQGNNTLTITLPNSWTTKQELNAGDEVDVEEKGEKLLVNSMVQEPVRRIKLDISGMDNPLAWRFFTSAYRSGYDEIELFFSNAGESYKGVHSSHLYGREVDLSVMEMIQDMVNRFVGVEIINQKANSCIVKEIGSETEKEFDNALRRVFILLEFMNQIILDSLSQKDKDVLKHISVADSNIDRFVDFCLRSINRRGYRDYRKTPTVHSLIIMLEFLGDEFKKISGHMLCLKKDVGAKFLEMYSEVAEVFGEFCKFYSKFERERAISLYLKIGNLCSQKAKDFSDEEKEIVFHVRKVKRLLLDLMQSRIDLEI